MYEAEREKERRRANEGRREAESSPRTASGPTERRRKPETHLGNLWETETEHGVSQSRAVCREADQVCLQPQIIIAVYNK